MRIVNISSGSDGNITFLQTEKINILIDDGLNATQTIEKLKSLNISPASLNAIIISHEHSDHIKGVDLLSSKYNIPVFAHQQVWVGLDEKLKKVSLKNRKVFCDAFEINDLKINPINLPHDVPCYGFAIENENKKMGIITDLGHFNDRILSSLSGSRIIYIESNYDKDMLYKGTKYPLSLKRRIDGPNGHLSNVDSAEALERLALGGTRQFVLAHLSKENNSPLLAYNTTCKYLQKDGIEEGKDIKIDVATTNIGTIFKIK